MNKKIALPMILIALLGMSGCASSYKAGVYQTGQVQQAMHVEFATVLETREVEIEGKPTGVGATTGAAAGGVAGLYSSGRGGIVTSIAGALVGGVAGAVVEKNVNEKKGIEVTYRVDITNEVMVLVQEADSANPIKTGDRIKIIKGSFSTRAVKANG
jgi:outer membrane lipoprotein SlyB